MSKKRRKPKPRTGYRTPAPVETARGSRPARSEVPPALGWLSRGSGDSAFPSIPRALARGMVTVGSSPSLLLASFLFVFLAWLGLVSLGMEGPPGRLVNMAALPPISTYFDTNNGVSIYGVGAQGVLAGVGFLVVRSVVLAVLAGLVVEALEGGRSAVAGALRGLRALPIVLAANVLSMSLLVTGFMILPFLGAGFAFLGQVLILIGTLFFLVFAPAAAIREGRGLQETLRRSARAAMMPGSRHALMSMFYVFLCLPVLLLFAPSANRLTVNPSLWTWVYSLVATFVHVSFLAAFTYRWMAVEREVPDQPVSMRRRRS